MARRTTRRPHAPVTDLLVVVAIGVAIVAAGLVPALTASAGTTASIEGVVTAGGAPVPGIRVGFWSPTERKHVLASVTTSTTGEFTLSAPSTSDGFLFAGTDPDSTTVVTTVAGRAYVRGLLGTTESSPVASPLYQGFTAATPLHLLGGAALQLRLQRAGRVTGTAAAGTTMQLRRLDGSLVQRLAIGPGGRYKSAPVAPGPYSVVAIPRSPAVPVGTSVVVRAGVVVPVATAAAALGATLSGRLTADEQPLTTLVPVLVVQRGAVVARAMSNASGDYSVPGLVAGTYSIEFGRAVLPPAGVTVVGDDASLASPTPSATPTTGRSTASPTDSSTTADAVLPAETGVTIDAARDDVEVDQDLEAAGTVAGRVMEGADGAAVTVVAEDSSTHALLRATTADPASGDFLLGGLPPGLPVDVLAVDSPADLASAVYGRTGVTADPGTTAPPIVLDQPALSVAGTVDAVSGSVIADEQSLVARTAVIDATGGYTLQGLLPGSHPLTVRDGVHLPSVPVAVDIQQSGAQNLAHGPTPGIFKAWFISGGSGLGAVSGRAVDEQGDEARIGPRLPAGHATVPGLTPGRYTFDESSFLGTVLATDGPWWFGPASGGFTIRSGGTTDVESFELHAHVTPTVEQRQALQSPSRTTR